LLLDFLFGHVLQIPQLASTVSSLLSQFSFHDVSVKSNFHTQIAALVLPLPYIISAAFCTGVKAARV
jgi:hypothetical protein